MFRLRDKTCCWFLGVFTLVCPRFVFLKEITIDDFSSVVNHLCVVCVFFQINGVCLTTVSIILFNQTLYLLIQQSLQKNETFAHVYREPFKNSNWMKSAVPLMVATTLGIFIGILQSFASLISLIMDNSKSSQVSFRYLINT